MISLFVLKLGKDVCSARRYFCTLQLLSRFWKKLSRRERVTPIAHWYISSNLKSTCDVENDKRCPIGGIDGCILLLNELL